MAAKKGLFQKTDQKKQYSENVLNGVESSYRPKNRGRVKNPISSNTMSGEEEEDFAEPLINQQDSTQQSRFRKPVNYAFAGPQAKRQKNQAKVEAALPAQTVESLQTQAPVAEFAQAVEAEFVVVEDVEQAKPEPEIQVRTGKPLKKKTGVAMQKVAAKKSKKLSQPEIQVFTGNPSKKLSQPEIQVITGNPLLEAMQELEVDVQESKGNYEPIEEAEIQAAKSLGFQRLFNLPPAKNALQYELDLDSIGMDEFQQSAAVHLPPQPDTRESNPPPDIVQVETLDATDAELFEEPLTEAVSAAELGLSFDPLAYDRDKKKTMALNPPKQGIKRSHRGTIEAVFQPNGRVVEAQYNRCGILIEVNVAGSMKLTRSAVNGMWTMSFCDESQPVNKVSNVSFDRLGNLCYSTEDGRTTVICADGRVVEK
ncbi:MAG: hypothetical protein C0469_06545 [Cyanobacteria bacterium DS2.3.42]|nr:hypothetical protein [Cyanobacteria bacterium DS2.3.42]